MTQTHVAPARRHAATRAVRDLVVLPRITVVHESREFVALMAELFAGRHAVIGVEQASVNAIADTRPDLLVADDRAPFPAWDLAYLARHHRDLSTVPLIVCTTDLMSIAAQRSGLAEHVDVHLLETPFELDELENVVARALAVGKRSSAAMAV